MSAKKYFKWTKTDSSSDGIDIYYINDNKLYIYDSDNKSMEYVNKVITYSNSDNTEMTIDGISYTKTGESVSLNELSISYDSIINLLASMYTRTYAEEIDLKKLIVDNKIKFNKDGVSFIKQQLEKVANNVNVANGNLTDNTDGDYHILTISESSLERGETYFVIVYDSDGNTLDTYLESKTGSNIIIDSDIYSTKVIGNIELYKIATKDTIYIKENSAKLGDTDVKSLKINSNDISNVINNQIYENAKNGKYAYEIVSNYCNKGIITVDDISTVEHISSYSAVENYTTKFSVVSEDGYYVDEENNSIVSLPTDYTDYKINSDGYYYIEIVSNIYNEIEKAKNNSKLKVITNNIEVDEGSKYNIGTEDKRLHAIYADEVHVSNDTLYIGETAVLGTESDTVTVKADDDQSILIKTKGEGLTQVTSESGINISTPSNGTNAIINISSKGTNGTINIAGSTDSGNINLTAKKITLTGDTTVQNLTVTGTTTTVDADNLKVKDNVIEINSGESGSGVSAGTAGIKVNRGELSPYLIEFDESDDLFKIGEQGKLETIATRDYVDDKALKSHASTTDEYGAGSADNYGHVKLSDTVSESSASSGIAATPAAVKSVDDKLSDYTTKTDFSKFSNSGSCYAYTGDVNDITVNSMYTISSTDCTNTPFDNNGFIVTMVRSSDTDNITQLAYSLNSTGEMWIRHKISGTWGDWASTSKSDDSAPKNHQSKDDTYGLGTGVYYGHVALSDSITSSSDSNAGVAATPAAVKSVNDKLSSFITLSSANVTGEVSGTTLTLTLH